ncbi:MAG: DUF4870 domain-containing protein [Clostridiales bacterium]|nr:DUF4870 domain-containing protein [Clostridiales bacterium]
MENNTNPDLENVQSAAPEVQAEAAPEAAPAAAEAPAAEGNFNQTNVIAYSVLAYLTILWLIGLLISPEKDSPIVKNHVNNGIILFLGEMVAGILYMIPYVGRYALGPLLSLVILVFAVLGIIKAVKGEKYELPIIGDKFTLIK